MYEAQAAHTPPWPAYINVSGLLCAEFQHKHVFKEKLHSVKWHYILLSLLWEISRRIWLYLRLRNFNLSWLSCCCKTLAHFIEDVRNTATLFGSVNTQNSVIHNCFCHFCCFSSFLLTVTFSLLLPSCTDLPGSKGNVHVFDPVHLSVWQILMCSMFVCMFLWGFLSCLF